MSTCPSDEQLFDLLDGRPSSDELRAHVASCATCSVLVDGLRAPAAQVDTEAGVARVMAHVSPDAGQVVPFRRPRRFGPLAIALAAAAAALVLFVQHREPVDEFVARGSADAGAWVHRMASAEVRAVNVPQQRLTASMQVPTSTRWFATVANADPTRPVFFMALLVTANREVSWLYPAHPLESGDEASLEVPPRTALGPLGEVVDFEALPEGPATIITVLSASPWRVRAVEALGDVTVEKLRARDPEAVVTALELRLKAP